MFSPHNGYLKNKKNKQIKKKQQQQQSCPFPIGLALTIRGYNRRNKRQNEFQQKIDDHAYYIPMGKNLKQNILKQTMREAKRLGENFKEIKP